MHLVIDNYDSFTYNVVQYLGMLGASVEVRRNDQIGLADIEAMAPTSLTISPGPCTPDEAGISIGAIRHFASRLPILGICLGHQCIAAAFDGQVRRANAVMHGKASRLRHCEHGIFQDIPQGITVGRYHSLVVDDLPSCLEVTAWEERVDGIEGEIMAIAHREYPIVGVQFHPESILTDCGLKMIANFLSITQGTRGPSDDGNYAI